MSVVVVVVAVSLRNRLFPHGIVGMNIMVIVNIIINIIVVFAIRSYMFQNPPLPPSLKEVLRA